MADVSEMLEIPETLLNPQYVFVLVGWDNAEMFIMGVFNSVELAHDAKEKINHEWAFAPQMKIQCYEIDDFDL